MQASGLNPEAAWRVILTHFHTDHTGGILHFPNSEFLVSADEYQSAHGFAGMLQGYLPQHWPEWFAPSPIQFESETFGPFDESYAVTKAGDVVIVPSFTFTSTATAFARQGAKIRFCDISSPTLGLDPGHVAL